MRYIVGIDTDGTIFDTMNIKHKEVFWQCMMERWGVPDPDGRILAMAERINLYSRSRGVNRFPGLLRVMEGCPSLAGLDKTPLRDFISSDYPTSNAGLEKYINDGLRRARLEPRYRQSFCREDRKSASIFRR